MQTISLSQALKLKNRLAGEYVRLANIFSRENSRRNDSTSKINPKEVYEKMLETSAKLGIIKAKIAAANINIYSEIERMAELKTQIVYLQQLNKREGEEIQFIGRDQEKMIYTYTATINQDFADNLIVQLQNQIEGLQDKIDSYNATTNIEL